MLYNTEWPNVDGFGPLTGYDVDASNLRALLPEMGYDIVADRQNLSADEMYSTVRDLAVADDFAQYDALMVILLSHGSDNRVYGADGDVVLLDSLYTLVSPVVCPLLKDKPKLFLVQACRGNQKMQVAAAAAAAAETPLAADYLKMFATPTGYVSWVHETKGSFYIEQFVEVMRGWNRREIMEGDHMIDALTEVNRRVGISYPGYPQVPELQFSLHKKLYMRPVYERELEPEPEPEIDEGVPPQ
jgi:hypothetical protein